MTLVRVVLVYDPAQRVLFPQNPPGTGGPREASHLSGALPLLRLTGTLRTPRSLRTDWDRLPLSEYPDVAPLISGPFEWPMSSRDPQGPFDSPPPWGFFRTFSYFVIIP